MGAGCQRCRQKIVTLKAGFSPKDFFIWAIGRGPWPQADQQAKVRFRLRVGKDIEPKSPAGAELQKESLCCRGVSPWKLFSPCLVWGYLPKAQPRPTVYHLGLSLKERQILEHHLKGYKATHSCGAAKGLPKEGVHCQKSFPLRFFFCWYMVGGPWLRVIWGQHLWLRLWWVWEKDNQ